MLRLGSGHQTPTQLECRDGGTGSVGKSKVQVTEILGRNCKHGFTG
jgi:hypothetical protein